jgi:GT2 family glycosyltransferase
MEGSRNMNQNEGKTLIIVLHYQSYEDTYACLSSLKDIPGAFDIMVINNGMGEGIEIDITRDFPTVRCLSLEENMGFAVANNFGLQTSLQEGYEFSLLLNNDVVVDFHFLEMLINVIEADEKIALAGPAIYYYERRDSLWAMGGWINLWNANIGGIINLDINNCPPYFDVDYLAGTCILIRNQALNRIGMLPEEYFLAYEEAEFAIKARTNGYRVVACRDSKIYHKVGMSSQNPPKYQYNSMRNRFLFLKRNISKPFNHIVILLLFLRMMLRGSIPRRLILVAFADHLKSDRIRREDLIHIEEGCHERLQRS